jgi:hypothetical protein
MRSRTLFTSAAVVACLAMAGPASAAHQRGVLPEARTTTVRAACVGGPNISVAVERADNGGLTITTTASNLPEDSLWDGNIGADEAGGGGGGAGGGFGGTAPSPDGTITDVSTLGMLVDPIVTANLNSEDEQMSCTVRLRVDRQFARTSCAASGRRIAVTALRKGGQLAVTSSLDHVRRKSAWNVRASVRSPHASEGAAGATHASAAGVVRSSFDFGYAVNRSVKVVFANRAGKSCQLSLGTHRTPVT